MTNLSKGMEPRLFGARRTTLSGEGSFTGRPAIALLEPRSVVQMLLHVGLLLVVGFATARDGFVQPATHVAEQPLGFGGDVSEGLSEALPRLLGHPMRDQQSTSSGGTGQQQH